MSYTSFPRQKTEVGFRCGIIGLPNVGKSTLFNALTRADVPAANYPFCTIDPNLGIVEVPDARLKKISKLVEPKKVIPATIEFVDIAGLVAGASRGEGLGNRFLAHIREVDALAHVVRTFKRQDITHVTDRIDPLADVETIDTELALADLETVDRAVESTQKVLRSGDKTQLHLLNLLECLRGQLDEGIGIRTMSLNKQDALSVRQLCLLTAKPVVYVVNVAEEELVRNHHLTAIRQHASRNHSEAITVSARIEEEIARLDDTDRATFLDEIGLAESGLDQVIRAGYRLLGLHTFFTAAPKEVRAWTIRVGARAPEAAGKIHTDFERGFIRAETIACDDFLFCGGEQESKEAGRLRVEGRDYVVRDGDIMNFRFNV